MPSRSPSVSSFGLSRSIAFPVSFAKCAALPAALFMVVIGCARFTTHIAGHGPELPRW